MAGLEMASRMYLCLVFWSCWTGMQADNAIKSHSVLSRSSSHIGSRSKRSVTVQLTAAEQEELLNIHNTLRAAESSSNMMRMSWNDVLAQMAQGWTDDCVFLHGDPDGIEPPYFEVGQNMYAIGGSALNLTAGVLYWYDEKPDYTFDVRTCTPGESCLHYTAVVWAHTYEVGCAYTTCPTLSNSQFTNAGFLVCNYGPAGNYPNEDIYKLGDACSQCEVGNSWCNGGLCDNSCASDSPPAGCECRAACQNCGTYHANNCSCSCPLGWDTADCSERCGDHEPRCNGQGWPVSWCTSGNYQVQISRLCHAACGLCEAGQPTESSCAVIGSDWNSGGGGGGNGGGNGLNTKKSAVALTALLVIAAFVFAQE